MFSLSSMYLWMMMRMTGEALKEKGRGIIDKKRGRISSC